VGRYAAALPLYEEASRIYRALVKIAPEAVEWTKDKEIVDSELKHCRRKV
jgi:hypothetical protein